MLEAHPGNAGLRKVRYHRIPCWLKYKAGLQTSSSFLVYHNNTLSPGGFAFQNIVCCLCSSSGFLRWLSNWLVCGEPEAISMEHKCAQDIRHDWYTSIASTHSPALKPQLTQLSGLQTSTELLACNSEELAGLYFALATWIDEGAINYHTMEWASL